MDHHFGVLLPLANASINFEMMNLNSPRAKPQTYVFANLIKQFSPHEVLQEFLKILTIFTAIPNHCMIRLIQRISLKNNTESSLGYKEIKYAGVGHIMVHLTKI